MAITQLQVASHSHLTTAAATFGSPLTPGSAIYVFVHMFHSTAMATPTRSDAGPAFTALGTEQTVGSYRGRWFRSLNPSLTTAALTVTCVDSENSGVFIAVGEYGAVDQTTPEDVAVVNATGSNGAQPRVLTGPATTPVTAGAFILSGVAGQITGADPSAIQVPTAGGTWTSIGSSLTHSTTNWGAAASFPWTSGTITPVWGATVGDTSTWNYFVLDVALRPASGTTRDQEGFRWRNDDGSETTATWKASQDTNVTSPLSANVRLRTLVDTVGDTPSTAYTLRYKKSTDSVYVPVPVGSAATGTAPVIEGTAETAVSTAGTSHAITLPASIASTDLVLILMDIGSTSATLNALTDWTEDLDESAANGLKILRYTGAGVPGNPTFTSSASTRSASIAYRISGADKAIAPQIGTTATGTSVNPNPPSVTPTGGTSKPYLFLAFFGSAGEEADDDTWVTAAPSGYTGLLQKTCGTAGTNLGGLIGAASRTNTSGSAEDPATFTMAVSAAWRAQTVIIHPIMATPPIYVSTSANVTAGGEATTFQLTAPSGKSTSDFVTGRMWDDENGTDTTDITTDDYSEFEWSLQAQSPAVNGDIYQFRVYAGTLAFDTYTVTPQWTIGTAAAPTPPPIPRRIPTLTYR